MTTANLALQDLDPVIQYTSTGETTFAFPFPVLASAELKVSVDQVLKTLGTDYTINGIGQAAGGEVVFNAATTPGERITLWLDVPLDRLTGFAAGVSTLLPQDLNTEFVRRVRVDQVLRRDIGRALRLAIDDPQSGQDMIVPTRALRAGRFLAFDAAGAPIAASGTGADGALRADLAASGGVDLVGNAQRREATIAAMLAIASPVDGLSALVLEAGRGGLFEFDVTATGAADNGTTFKADDATVGSWVRRFSGAINVQWYGADPSGANDSHAAFQAAVDAAEASYDQDAGNFNLGGGAIWFPTGIYRTDAPTVFVKRGLHFFGDGRATTIFCGGAFPDNRAIFQSRDVSDRGLGATIHVLFSRMNLYAADPRAENFGAPYAAGRRGIWITGLDGAQGPCGFEHLGFRGFERALMLAAAWRFHVSYCAFLGGRSNNRIGVALSFGETTADGAVDAEANSGVVFQINIPTIIGCHFQFLSGAMRWRHGRGGSFIGNTIEQNESTSGAVVLVGCEGVLFTGGYHEANIGPVYRLSLGGGGNEVKNCLFTGNFFTTRGAGGTSTSDFFIHGAIGTRIVANSHRPPGSGHDIVTAAAEFTCKDCDIEYTTLFENTAINRALNKVRDLAVLDTQLPRAAVRLASAQSIPNNTNTVISWTTEIQDIGGFWASGAPTTFVIPAGVNRVRVSAMVEFASNDTGLRRVMVNKNGTAGFHLRPDVQANATVGGSTRLQVVSTVLEVAENDTLSLVVLQTSGVSLDVASGQTTWFAVEAVRND